MLINLYGLCSGDKRSFEFAEAFHGNLADVSFSLSKTQHFLNFALQAVRAYVESIGGEIERKCHDRDLTRLKEALYIIDIYRATIMFRPPAMVWRSIPEVNSLTPVNHDRYILQEDVIGLVDGSLTTPEGLHLKFPLARLASLAPFLWPAMYPRQNQYNDENVHVESMLLAKPDFAGQACTRWFQQHETRDPMHLVLYHTMYILLHANMTTLQTYAHSSLGPHTRDITASAVAREVHDWVTSRHFKVAYWHAEQVLSVIENSFVVTKRDTTQRCASRMPGSNIVDSRSLTYEAPHVPYAVYFAALILWCRVGLNSDTASIRQAPAPIPRAEKILWLHKMHVAQLLASVLNDIK